MVTNIERLQWENAQMLEALEWIRRSTTDKNAHDRANLVLESLGKAVFIQGNRPLESEIYGEWCI